MKEAHPLQNPLSNLTLFLSLAREIPCSTLCRLTDDVMAEGVGFEPTVAFTTPVFKTGLFDHSSTPPGIMSGNTPEDKKMRNSYEVNSAKDNFNTHMVDDWNGNLNILS